MPLAEGENGGTVVKVTLRDVYEAVEAIQGDLHELKTIATGAAKIGDDHEVRLRAVENQIAAITGGSQTVRSTWAIVIAAVAVTISAASPIIYHITM